MKAVIIAELQDVNIVISGGADGAIIVWDVATAKKLHVLKGHARGVQALAVDKFQSSKDAVEFVSADSSREIRRWRLTPTAAQELSMVESADAASILQPLVAHETSVYGLWFDTDGDLWTASADKTAKCLVRTRRWEEDTSLTHPDFVKDVVVDEDGGWVITACRDEEIRLWDRASEKVFHTFSGHFEEVTGLLLLDRKVISISIDATVRRWSLQREDIEQARQEAEAEKAGKSKPEEVTNTPNLTEEEERELAELMDEDD